mgnify:CR=1 FL=1
MTTKAKETWWIKCQNCGHYVETEINAKGEVVNSTHYLVKQ